MKCTVCGTENMADSMVCVKCGSKLVPEQPPKPEETQNQIEQTPGQTAVPADEKPKRDNVSKVFMAWFLFNAFGSASSAFNILKELGDVGPIAILGAIISVVNCIACVLLVVQKKMMWFYVFAATIVLNFFYVNFAGGDFEMTFALIMLVIIAAELGISYFLVKRNKAYLS